VQSPRPHRAWLKSRVQKHEVKGKPAKILVFVLREKEVIEKWVLAGHGWFTRPGNRADALYQNWISFV
jgi:hypothetical protein